jgi:TatD DNase family protein
VNAEGLAWFDSHCHVQEHYEPDAAVLTRAAALGVSDVVCIGTDVDSSTQALELAAAAPSGAPRIWASVGLHPHEASRGVSEVAALLDRAVAAEHPPVAVGECGLDYFYEHSPRAAQQAAFAAQIRMAHRHDLALVIHARDAWDDLFDVLGAEGVPERTVLHCFSGGPKEATRCLDAGLFLSFSGIVTFKNAADVREAAVLCPLDRLLIETDSPFLTPVPHRGERNEPALVALVGECIATQKGVDPSVIAISSADSATRLFALDRSRLTDPPL